MKIAVLLLLFRFFDAGPINRIPVMDFNSFETYLNRKNDTIYVMNFWASWCLPCREELPDFERLHKTYRSEPVKVILISLDMPDQIGNWLFNQNKTTIDKSGIKFRMRSVLPFFKRFV